MVEEIGYDESLPAADRLGITRQSRRVYHVSAIGRSAGRRVVALVRRVLVAGMGNLLRADDGFGIRVIQELAKKRLPPSVDLYEAGGAGIALAQKLADGYEVLIIVDAALRGGIPGTLYRIIPPEGPPPGDIGMHDLDPTRVLALAKVLGASPGETIVIGCEPRETGELSQELSPEVSAAVEGAVAMVLKELKRVIG